MLQIEEKARKFRLKNNLFDDPAAANVISLLDHGMAAGANDVLETCVGSYQADFSVGVIFVA